MNLVLLICLSSPVHTALVPDKKPKSKDSISPENPDLGSSKPTPKLTEIETADIKVNEKR